MNSLALLVTFLGPPPSGSWAQAPPADMPLVDMAAEEALARITPGQPDQVTVARAEGAPGAVVTCRPGESDYPGIVLKPEAAVWDLSAFGHVDARVANTGTIASGVSVRLDNEGDWTTNPWSSETLWVGPGQTGTVRVYFGYSWGKPGFALNPAKVTQLLVFVGKADQEQSLRIESIVAGGAPGEKPPVDPDSIRERPADGILLGKGTAVDAGQQLGLQAGARAEVSEADGAQSLQVTLPAGADEAVVLLKPAVGLWDLRDWLQVVVHARNEGRSPVTVRARLENRGRASEWVVAPAPLAPGAEQDLVLPFGGDMAVYAATGEPKSGGSLLESDCAAGVGLAAAGEGERILRVDSICAVVPPPPTLPDWLGKRPPEPGDWSQTLAEEFDGATLNEAVWSIRHPNYWDRRSHFSQDNVILGDGVLRLRFEKRRGHADDDPAKPETDWATGFITSTTKWRQRYGYFECRLKLPTAPGLWPAFWMMPDRGPEAGAARESTSDGGMEFDILEYLTRYGPYRYNIALHWDGYGEDHKANGTDRIYVQPDAEGYITAGLLWEPGRLTFYANGKALLQCTDPRVASVPEYILFTAVSGGWGGNNLTGEGLPDDLILDYVRAWQRSDWAEH